VALRFEADRLQSQSPQQLALQAQECVLITGFDTIAGNKSVALESRNFKVQEVQSIMKSTTDRQEREAL
jgi:hypothetical protein